MECCARFGGQRFQCRSRRPATVITSNPCLRSSTTVARSIPLLAPVTNATRANHFLPCWPTVRNLVPSGRGVFQFFLRLFT
jgi:hypothetical protein